MSGGSGDGNTAEPDLTPMLDMVFQLITFFMLVINFKSASMDLSLKLPIIGSARPVEVQGIEDFLVLNVNKEGQLVIYGTVVPVDQYLSSEARVSRMKLPPAERNNPNAELPTSVVIRADRAVSFKNLNYIFTECQKRGFRKFSLKAFNMEDPAT
ncbi:MAG TPA: biopolymer transporter ExbD [Planctomicrobium sp.]|nr:biopolymer transporter ExbD [Planctomicrobium sp.]